MQTIPQSPSLTTHARSTDQTSPTTLFRPFNHFSSTAISPGIGGVTDSSHKSAFKPVAKKPKIGVSLSLSSLKNFSPETYILNKPTNSTLTSSGSNYYDLPSQFSTSITGGINSYTTSTESMKSISNFAPIKNSTMKNVGITSPIQQVPKIGEQSLDKNLYKSTYENSGGGKLISFSCHTFYYEIQMNIIY